jgi:hypothetical protein
MAFQLQRLSIWLLVALARLTRAKEITRTYSNGTVQIILSTSLLSPGSGLPSIFPKVETNWTLILFTSTNAGICSDEMYEDTAIGGHSCVALPESEKGHVSVEFDAGGQHRVEFYGDSQCEEAFVSLTSPMSDGECERLERRAASYVVYHVGVETKESIMGKG